MSGLILIFPVMIFISLCVAFLMGRFVFRKMCSCGRWGKYTISMFVGVVVFAAGVFYAIENASDKFKFSVLPSEVPMKLPKDASDVDYRWSWGGSRYTADFNISETGFLNWMKEMGLLNRTNRFTTYDNNAWHLLGRSACASVSKVFGTWIQ